MKQLLPLLILINCHMIQVSGVLEWIVTRKVTDYGQNVTLFCNISNCCPKASGWDRYTPEQQTLFIDVKTASPNRKYDGKVLKDGYTLIIQNLTSKDLNVSYSCVYGATIGQRIFLLEEDVFTDKSDNKPTGNSRLSKIQIAGIIIGVVVPIAVAVVAIVIWYLKKRKKRPKSEVEMPLLNEDCFLGDPSSVDCIEGQNAILTCEVSHTSLPVEWLKDGNAVKLDENCEQSNEGTKHNLIIKNVKLDDRGKYCVKVGNFSREIQLKIKEIPTKDERNRYEKAMQTGTEIRQYVRIQVIGKDRVGKTSLVRRLLGKQLDDVISTDGIDIDKTCQIRTSDGEWIVGEVETEKIERMRRLLQAVDIKHKEIDTNSTQSQALSKNEEKRNVQKLGRSEDHSKDTERRQNKPHQSNRHSIKRDEKKNEQEKTTLEYLNSSAAPKSNPDKEKLNIDDKENTPKPREKDTLTPKQIHDESSLSPVNHNFKNTDDITDAMISEMDTIILDAKNQKELMTSEGLVKCGIWDFAGQRDYYATHQTFFTPHAIYILVTDITEDIKSFKQDEEFNSIEDYIDFWFDCIHCFCKDGSDHTDQLCPPVLMVCTGTDKVEKVEERKVAFNEQFDRTFHDQAKVNHRRGIYFLSNKEDGHHEIKNLKDHISKIAKQMGYFAESLPTKWIHLENALAVLKGFNIDVYEWENMLKLAHNNSIEEDELLLFLNNQHKIGNVIFFNELKEYIILQPAWLVKCFRCLVDDWNPEKRKDAISLNETACQTLKTTGELSETLIDQLFQKEPTLQFGNRKRYLLSVMEKFDIIVQPEFRDTENDKCQKSHSYYLPCMIEKSLPFDDIKKIFIKPNVEVTITPWLVFEFKFLPLAYFNHILFYYLRNYTVCKEKTEHPALYRGKAVFYLDRDKLSKFIICFSRNAISLQIWKWSDVDENMYKKVLNELCDRIDSIRGTMGQNLSYYIKAKCQTADFAKRVGRIGYEDLLEKDLYMCEEHDDTHSKTDIVNTWLKHDFHRKKIKQTEPEEDEKKRQVEQSAKAETKTSAIVKEQFERRLEQWKKNDQHVDVVKELLQHSADVNKCSNNGTPPLQIACYNNLIEVVHELLQCDDVDIDFCDDDGCSSLYWASKKGHVDVVKELLQHSADVNKCSNDGTPPLQIACYNNLIEVVHELLQCDDVDIDFCDNDGCSSLYWASQNGHVDVVKELLQHSADVNKCTNNDASPLYIARQNGHVAVVKELLQHAADVKV